jgi:NAD(P)H-hydrate epimerase
MRRIPYWIDAILGTGLNSDVKGYFRQVIEFVNGLQRPVFAVDIPSGLNADTGQPCGVCINASATATFAFAKIGHVVYPGAQYCGAVDVIDIGIPPHIARAVAPLHRLLDGETVRGLLPDRRADTHKGQTGHLLVIAGSPGKTGAAAMSAESALRSGAGLVTLGVAESLNPIMEAKVTEAMTCPLPESFPGVLGEGAEAPVLTLLKGKQCLAIGPGIGTAEGTARLVRQLLPRVTVPMVIDADGLNCLAESTGILDRCTAPVVITPHPGEMARLTGTTSAEI